VAVEFVIRSLYEFLAHNPIYQLHYDTPKLAKEIFIVLEIAAVMLWETADYLRNCLSVLVLGPLSVDMTCWCDL